jgi:hypothetical protein
MSLLENRTTNIDLSRGLSWNALIDIEITGVPRRKVIWEACNGDGTSPSFRIALNALDQLYAEVEDNENNRFRTPYVEPIIYGMRLKHLTAELLPKIDVYILTIKINGREVACKTIPHKFTGKIVNGVSSLGSAFDHLHPATFVVSEIVVYVPGDQDSYATNLVEYFRSKATAGNSEHILRRKPSLEYLNHSEMSATIEDLEKIGISTENGLEIALAHQIIINTLGLEFYKRECTSYSTTKQPFFNEKQYVRQVHLANCLWKLRECVGYKEFLRREQKGDFESAYYELVVAAWFRQISSDVQLVIPSGRKSYDFDIKAKNVLGFPTLNVEIKARSQSFKDRKVLSDYLAKSRQQLPQDGDGAIFLKIMIDEDSISQNIIRDTIVRFLKGTDRVKLVVYIWDVDIRDRAIALSYEAINRNGIMKPIFPPMNEVSFLRDTMCWRTMHNVW